MAAGYRIAGGEAAPRPRSGCYCPEPMPTLASFEPLRNLRYLGDLVRWAWSAARESRRRRREPRLTVAVDVAPLWESLTGIGWYLFRLLELLAEREDLVLRLYGPDLLSFPETPPAAVALPAGRALERVVYRPPAPPKVALARVGSRLLRLLGPALIAADGNDVVFAPNYFPPRRFVLALARGTALVATVHDMGYRKVPWAIRRETLEDLERNLAFVGARATLVLTDSEAVRREIVAAGLAGANRVQAIHLAPAHDGAAAAASPPPTVPGSYALFVGTVEPRKNLELLLAVWQGLRRRRVEPPPLVVCGKVGWATEELRRDLEKATREGWLVPLGYATDGELAALYRDATLVLLPSWYEGFGLPALEACAAGAPVVASDLPVLREVLGDGARYAPPDRPDLWMTAITELLRDDRARAELGRRGTARAGRFGWSRTAAETAEAWRAAAART